MAGRDFMRRFGDRLREIRTSKGLSQEELAGAAGLHRTHVSLIERGRRSVRLETLERRSPEPWRFNRQRCFRLFRASRMADELVHHPDKAELDRLFPAIRRYQALARRHGIGDIFQDNGGKLLQTLLILNLECMKSREGNDARDASGNEYELKTVNVLLTRSFSTHHHLNPTILNKYRHVAAWYFSSYRGIELVKIYRVLPAQLEQDFFTPWERKWRESGGKDINNPKIPVAYVERIGKLVFAQGGPGAPIQSDPSAAPPLARPKRKRK